MGDLFQDLRYGIRMLLKKPGFTVVAALTLAIGIGANTAIFSVVNVLLLRPLPYEKPHQLMLLDKAPIYVGGEFTPCNFLNWRDRAQSFERLAAYRVHGGGVNLTGGTEPERVEATEVKADFFPTLGISPILGRAFLADEEVSGRNRVVIVGQGLWKRRFGADPELVGKTVALNEISFTVIGIAPSGFDYPGETELWIPPAMGPDRVISGSAIIYEVIGRLKEGVSQAQAQAEMNTFSEWLKQEFPNTNISNRAIEVIPLNDKLVGSIKPALLILFGAVGFVLAIASANVANLLLARAAARRKEMAIRSALGARRWRIMRQLLAESLLLALIGGVIGMLIAWWGVDLLVALAPPEIPRLDEVNLSWQVLGFTLAISLFTGILFGLAPAFKASKVDLNESLKDGAIRSESGAGYRSIRSLLVSTEVALALILLIGAGLLIKSFFRLGEVDPGLNAENTLTVAFSLPRSKYSGFDRQEPFYRQAIERLQSLPGAEYVGAINYLPFSKAAAIGLLFSIEGVSREEQGKERFATHLVVNEDYFRAMGIPILRGRPFTEKDVQGSQPVVIINHTMAERFWPNESPIGKRITFDGEDGPFEIVGVARVVKHWGLENQTYMEIYRPYLQADWPLSAFVIRASGDPMNLVGAVREQIKSLDADLPLYDIKTMEQRLSESVAKRRFTLLLLTVFAALAMLLAAVGIYGVMSYTVSRRTHEIGIRMALGAQTTDVLRLVIGQGFLLSLFGVAMGLGGAFALTRLMESLLFEVSATDTSTFLIISLLLMGIAMLAAYIPARRATKVDPMEALRYE